MRLKDIEQALLLEEKIRLHATYLMESGARGIIEPDGVEAFLTSFGSYKELITDDCDTVEISRRIFHTIQEISQLASNLYKAATGYELPARSFSSVGERHSEQYQSPKLPTRGKQQPCQVSPFGLLILSISLFFLLQRRLLVVSMSVAKSNNTNITTTINRNKCTHHRQEIGMMPFYQP